MNATDRYREVLERLDRDGADAAAVRRLGEPLTLLDLAASLGSGAGSDAALGAGLAVVMRGVDAAAGALFVRNGDGVFEPRAVRGIRDPLAPLAAAPAALAALPPDDPLRERHGLELLVPIPGEGAAVGVFALGPGAGPDVGSDAERAFLSAAAAVAAGPLASLRLQDQLRHANRELSLKAFQLHNLFDISRELTGRFAEDAIEELVLTTVMGHFVVSRSALFRLTPGGLERVRARGLRAAAGPPVADAARSLAALPGAVDVSDMEPGALRGALEGDRLSLAVPLAVGDRVEGLLAIGPRASGAPFSAEDRAFAATLARQAMTAVENARLQRLREEKQRQDRELQVAREIQRSLFPRQPPEIAGFEVAALSRPCHEVGGDAYDWIPLDGGCHALLVADVAGKGTPASLLMASVHASVQALARTAGSPAAVVERLDRFLFANTQASRYVTLFYAELDPGSRRLAYVNAGHVPPYRLTPEGEVTRLGEGGPAPGLLEEARYATGEVILAPGDVVAMVTDGVTEAGAEDDREFGDARVCSALRAGAGTSAAALLEGLVAAVEAWMPDGLADDLTAVILRAD